MLQSRIVTLRGLASSHLGSFHQFGTGRTDLYLSNSYRFSKFKPPLGSELDYGNLKGFLEASETSSMTFMEKLSNFSFGNMYNSLDIFSREALWTLCDDYSLGLPLSIFLITAGLKLIYLYPTIIAQVNGAKMKQLKPEMEKYQERIKAAQTTMNRALMKEAQKDFSKTRRKLGIDSFTPLINLTQAPFLITWFLSLRYVTNLPEIYPQLLDSNFLWISDFSVYDPYFIFPITAAVFTSLSIMYSPNLKPENISMPIMIPFIKFLKYMPFLSLPYTALFPAALSFYWCTLALMQLGLTGLMYTPIVKRKLINKEKIIQPKTIQVALFQDKEILNDTSKDSKAKGAKQPVRVLTNKPKIAKKKKADRVKDEL